MVEVFGDEFDAAELFPEEAEAVGRAVPKRRAEFAAVRECGRRALALAGFAPAPILPGPNREPQWPAGAVGSMTHCAGYRACAVGRAGEVGAIGIDAEPHEDLPDGVLTMVASEPERAALAGLRHSAPGICYEKILFCAKESVYKAWYPATGRWLGFHEAEVEIDPGGEFTARLLVPGPVVAGRQITGYHGRWLVDRGLIGTVVTA